MSHKLVVLGVKGAGKSTIANTFNTVALSKTAPLDDETKTVMADAMTEGLLELCTNITAEVFALAAKDPSIFNPLLASTTQKEALARSAFPDCMEEAQKDPFSDKALKMYQRNLATLWHSKLFRTCFRTIRPQMKLKFYKSFKQYLCGIDSADKSIVVGNLVMNLFEPQYKDILFITSLEPVEEYRDLEISMPKSWAKYPLDNGDESQYINFTICDPSKDEIKKIKKGKKVDEIDGAKHVIFVVNLASFVENEKLYDKNLKLFKAAIEHPQLKGVPMSFIWTNMHDSDKIYEKFPVKGHKWNTDLQDELIEKFEKMLPGSEDFMRKNLTLYDWERSVGVVESYLKLVLSKW